MTNEEYVTLRNQLLEQTKKEKSAIGKTQLIKHLQGKRITRGEAILAQCFICFGGYDGGKEDCKTSHCSLYPWMPYRKEFVEHRRKVDKRTKAKLQRRVYDKRRVCNSAKRIHPGS